MTCLSTPVFLRLDQSSWSGTWKPKFWSYVDHPHSIRGYRTTTRWVISKTSSLHGITGGSSQYLCTCSIFLYPWYIHLVLLLWLFLVFWQVLQSLSSESWPTWLGHCYLCIGRFFQHQVLIMMLMESSSTKWRQPSPVTVIHWHVWLWPLPGHSREAGSIVSGIRLLGPSPVSVAYRLCKLEWAI